MKIKIFQNNPFGAWICWVNIGQHYEVMIECPDKEAAENMAAKMAELELKRQGLM